MRLSSPFVLGHGTLDSAPVPQLLCTVESRNLDGSIEFSVINGAWNGRLHLGMMTVYAPRGNKGPYPVRVLAQGEMLQGLNTEEAFDLARRRHALPALLRIPVYVYPLLSRLTRLPGALLASCSAFATVFKSVMRYPDRKELLIDLNKPAPKSKASWVCGNDEDDIPY